MSRNLPETSEKLMADLDNLATSFHFQIFKKNGDKEYIYLHFNRAGKGRCIPQDGKQTLYNPNKTGKPSCDFS